MLPEKIENFIKTEKLFNKNDKILLAISGGCDSVALFHIFLKLNIKFAVAHCNFKLRDKDSDLDEKFVRDLAKSHNIKLFINTFNTLEYAEKNKLSVEDAARKLRYDFFEKIRRENNFSYIATAHHLNDNIETFFINLIKGTGIKGLRGILPLNGKIIRPMLSVTRNEIKYFCERNDIKYRQDKSNFDNYFLRNNLRNNILPLFKEINPKFEKSMQKNLNILKDIEKIYNFYIETEKEKILKIEKEAVFINTELLLNATAPDTLLFEILRRFGFNSAQTREITNKLKTKQIQTGKMFYSASHKLLVTDNSLIIKKLTKYKTEIENIEIKSPEDFENPFIGIKITDKKNLISTKTDKNTILVDFKELTFPLIIRKPKKGDYFYPFGMKGRKLLSDFFTDSKINRFEREKILILTTVKDEIVWIIGHRFDDRFKVNEKTRKVLKIERL